MILEFQNIPPSIYFACGFAVGFIFWVYVLDRLYRFAMCKYQEETTNQYNQINQGLINKIKTLEKQIKELKNEK